MNIGIIVYSYTGNTLNVAQRLKDQLESKGHTVGLESIKAKNEDPKQTQVELSTTPNPSNYDAIVLGTPVRGFQVSPIMKAYLQQMPELNQKKVACFVTHTFPLPWLGGNQTINAMRKLVEAKNAVVSANAVINWGSKHREANIIDLLTRFSDPKTWDSL